MAADFMDLGFDPTMVSNFLEAESKGSVPPRFQNAVAGLRAKGLFPPPMGPLQQVDPFQRPPQPEPPTYNPALAGMLGLSPGVAFAEQAMEKGLGGAAKEDLATAWAHRPSAHTVIPAAASAAALAIPGLEPEGVAGMLGLGASLPARMAASGLTQGTAAGLSDLAAYVWDRLHGRTQAPIASELPHAAETGVLGGVVGAGLEPLAGGFVGQNPEVTSQVEHVLGPTRTTPQVVKPGMLGSMTRLVANIGRGSFLRGEQAHAAEEAQVAGMPQRVAEVMQRMFQGRSVPEPTAIPAAMQTVQGQLVDNLQQQLAAPRAEYERLIQKGLPPELKEEQQQLTQAVAARVQTLAKLGLTPADDPQMQLMQQRLSELSDASNLPALQRQLSQQLTRSRTLGSEPVTDTSATAGQRSALDTASGIRDRISRALDTLGEGGDAYKQAAQQYRAAFQRYGNEVVEHVLNQQPDQLADWLLDPKASLRLSRMGGKKLTLSRADIINTLKGALSPEQIQSLQGTLATRLFTRNIDTNAGTIDIGNVLQALAPTKGMDRDLAGALFGQQGPQVLQLAHGMASALKQNGMGTVFIALEQMGALGATAWGGIELARGNHEAGASSLAYGTGFLAMPYVLDALLTNPKLTNYFVDAINAPSAIARQRLITRVATMPLFQAALGKSMAVAPGTSAQVSTQPGGNLLNAGRLTPPPPHP